MAEHGTRAYYQATGCSCSSCRQANTTYIRQYRLAYRLGRPPLGAHVAGTEAHTLIGRLLAERFTKGTIAQLLGQRWPVLQIDDGVTLRTALKLRRLVRLTA